MLKIHPPTVRALLLGLGLLTLGSIARAQTAPQNTGSVGNAAPPASARAAEPSLEPSRNNQTIERIRTEDGGSRIDELRVGGQTQSIVVQPKADMPAYEIRPPDARGNTGQAGARMWNFLKF